MKKTAYLIIALGLAAFLAGCGKSEPGASDSAATPGSGASSEKAADAAKAANGRPVDITANDAMKFSVTEIRAKPGETLSVTLSNIGTMPKFSMGHNWVLFKPNANVETFVAEAGQAATTDYIPASRKAEVLANTKLLGPKEKDTITFQAPKEPGRYTFICSFPGHYQVGMKGVLIVE